MTNVNCRIFLVVILFPLIPSTKIYYDNHNLADVTLFIIHEHLKQRTPTIVLAEYSTSLETAKANAVFRDYLLQNLKDEISVQLYIGEMIWDYYILIIDSLDAFRALFRHIPDTLNDRVFYFLIILTNKSTDWMNIIEEIFIDCYNNSVFNVNIIVDHSSRISMYTYLMFMEKKCRRVKPVLYFSFDQDFKNLEKLFPEKLTNFHRCPLKVAARIDPPFINFSGNISDPKPVGDWENLAGFEGTLLKFLSQNLNFTIELLPFTRETNYVHNNISHGVYFKLLNGGADIAIGSLSATDQSRKHFSQSFIYYKVGLKHVIRGKIQSSLIRLGKPLNAQVWLLITAILLAITFSIFTMKFMKISVRHFVFGERNKSAVLNFITLLVGSPVTGLPRRNFARFLLMMFLLLNLVLRTAYLGSLYEVIWVNKIYSRPPRNYEELIKEEYTYLLPPEIAVLDLHPKNQVVIVESPFTDRLYELDRKDGNFASVILMKSFIYYLRETQKLNRETDLYIMDDNFFTYQIAMSFPKRSILLDIFNQRLLESHHSGVMEKLKRELNFDLRDLNVVALKRLKLRVKHLQAMFEVFLSLNICATIMFGLEILSKRICRLRRIFDWLA